jgi:O-antigen/teichoic acid export membrane protein
MEVSVNFFARRLAKFSSSGLSFLLRLGSLAGKFGLSIYMARYLSLDDLGLYGLVFSVSMVAVTFYGGRIDYDLARQIVTMNKQESYCLLRDQSVFFTVNYMLTVPLLVLGQDLFRGSFALLSLTSLICWLESYSNFLFVNTNFLGKPILANVAFFVRSGLWSIVVIVAGMALPSVRTLWFVLVFWVAGTGLSIVLNLWFLDVQYWPGTRSAAIDWGRIRVALRRSLPIWIGSIGLVGGSYLDRFVLDAFLNLKAVGLATFYTSFAGAVVTLMSSSILNVVAPTLVSNAERGHVSAYNQELRRARFSVAALGGVLCGAISISIPYLASAMHKPEIGENVLALWLLMAATLVRLMAETAFFGLYSRHKDREIWIGNVIFLFASLLLNLMLVPLLGLKGLGLSSIVASVILLALRQGGLRSLRA